MLKEVQDNSVDFENKLTKYNSNAWQNYAVSRALNDKSAINVNVVPTGSGKTWMTALLSRILKARGRHNAIVTSDTYLVKQL